MILYIHGFRTTPTSFKATLLREHYTDKLIVSNHSHIPDIAIKDLETIIEEQNITGIIASSIGGFYATYLSEKYQIKTVLINPSVRPYETTKKYLGNNTKDNGASFLWEEKHLEMLKSFKVEKPTVANYFLFLQKGDEVLDYSIAENFYRGSRLILEEDGNHRFKGFNRFFGEIEEFFREG